VYIAYFDESGDDGYPGSSQIFVLTSVYMHFQTWKENYNRLTAFRAALKEHAGFPVNLEFKAKNLMLNKRPYRRFGWELGKRKLILDRFIDIYTALQMSAINVVINKRNLKDSTYGILDRALNYNIQRIENDLHERDPIHKFMIITDEGRIGKMRKTTRKIQRINFIPSIFDGRPYRKEIEKLIEDPLPKDSRESYFIQTADTIAWLIYLFYLKRFIGGKWRTRLENILTVEEVEQWLDLLSDKGILNLKASKEKHGIVHYAK